MAKKFLSAMMAFAMLFATSCQNDIETFGTSADGAAEVTFSIETPELATRAFSDGLSAKDLQYAVYDSDLELLGELSGTETFENLTTSVNLTLTTGNTYTVLFWADNENAPYTFDETTKTVTVDYAAAKTMCNDENRDAFFASHTFTVNGKQTETVKLYRPFSQLNIGTCDYAASESAGYKPTMSAVKVKNVYTTLNLLTGVVDGSTEVYYDYTEIPTTETFPVEGYEYLSMNYLLVSKDKELVEVEFSYMDPEEYDEEKNKTRIIGAVPVQRNFRTNIYGKLLTSEVDINVEIVPVYNEPAYEMEVWNGKDVKEPAYDAETNTYSVKTGAELAWIATQATGTYNVVLLENIDLGSEQWFPIGKTEVFSGVFDGNGMVINNLEYYSKGEDYFAGLFACVENATIKNLTINNVDINLSGEGTWGHIGAVAGWTQGNVRFENINVTGSVKIEGQMDEAGSQRIGAVVGGNQGGNVTLSNIVVDAAAGSYVKGNAHVGGIAGQLQGYDVYENCSSNIDVQAYKFFAGGIAGIASVYTTFTNCASAGNISVIAGRAGNANDLYRVGGIAGGWGDNATAVLELTNCSYTGTLSGKDANGAAAVAFDNFGYVGRGYKAAVGAKVVVNGVEFVYKGNGQSTANGADVVTTSEAFAAAIANGTEVYVAGGNYNLPAIKDKDVTILGSKDAVITIKKPNLSGANLTLTGVTVKGSGYATGVQHVNTVTYNDVKVIGEMCLYGEAVTFNNCEFELNGKYIWTYGAKNTQFNNCVFNTTGKAILVYNEGAGATNVNVNGCTFNASAGAKAGAIANQNCAAIEIDNFQNSGVGVAHNVTASGNTYDANFSGEWRIKNFVAGNSITVNGTEYTQIAIDGKLMTIDSSKNVTVIE